MRCMCLFKKKRENHSCIIFIIILIQNLSSVNTFVFNILKSQLAIIKSQLKVISTVTFTVSIKPDFDILWQTKGNGYVFKV